MLGAPLIVLAMLKRQCGCINQAVRLLPPYLLQPFAPSGMLSRMPLNKSIISGAKWKSRGLSFFRFQPEIAAISSACRNLPSMPTFSFDAVDKILNHIVPHVSLGPEVSQNCTASLTPFTIASLMPVTFSTMPSQIFWKIFPASALTGRPQNSIAS